MGSSASVPEATKPAQTSSEGEKVEFYQPNKKEGPQLSGIRLIEHKCRKKERAWKKCVQGFYNEKFLPGQSMDQEEYCGQKFETYRRCYLKGMQVEFWDKKQEKPTEFSFMGEFASEEEED